MKLLCPGLNWIYGFYRPKIKTGPYQGLSMIEDNPASSAISLSLSGTLTQRILQDDVLHCLYQ